MARETCPCGAEVTTDRHPEPNTLVRGFRDAHAACRVPPPAGRVGWQVCPVCGGRGLVPHGFYNTAREFMSTSTADEQCRRCNGNGTIPLPPPATVAGGVSHGA